MKVWSKLLSKSQILSQNYSKVFVDNSSSFEEKQFKVKLFPTQHVPQSNFQVLKVRPLFTCETYLQKLKFIFKKFQVEDENLHGIDED